MSWLPSAYQGFGPQPQMAPGLFGVLGMQANPFTSYLGDHSNALLGLASGLLSSPTFAGGLSAGFANAAQGDNTDYTRRLTQNTLDLQIAQRNAMADWATQNGHKDWADLLRAGGVSGSDVFNLLNKQTVVPQGSSVIDGQGNVVQAPPGGQYLGTGMDAQNWNIVMKAQSDKTGKLWQTPEAQAAWAQVSQPQTTFQTTPQGVVPVYKAPALPPGWGPPTSSGNAPAPVSSPAPMAAPQGGAGPAPLSPDVAPIGQFGSGVSAGAPIPGTKPQLNESMNRINILGKMAIPDLKNAVSDFSSLRNPSDQLLAKDPTGLTRGLQSPAYQRAQIAVRASISNILYTVSGAAVGDKELERKINDLTPQFGEDVSVSAQKLDRLGNYIDAIAAGSGDPSTIAAAKDAEVGIAAAKAKMLGGGKPVVDLGNGVTIQEMP